MDKDNNFFWNYNNLGSLYYTTYNPNVSYTVTINGNNFSISPDLNAIYEKADKEFDALEDQTSIAKQMLNDIGIKWNEE
jgi:hypothetical protein